MHGFHILYEIADIRCPRTTSFSLIGFALSTINPDAESLFTYNFVLYRYIQGLIPALLAQSLIVQDISMHSQVTFYTLQIKEPLKSQWQYLSLVGDEVEALYFLNLPKQNRNLIERFITQPESADERIDGFRKHIDLLSFYYSLTFSGEQGLIVCPSALNQIYFDLSQIKSL